MLHVCGGEVVRIPALRGGDGGGADDRAVALVEQIDDANPVTTYAENALTGEDWSWC